MFKVLAVSKESKCALITEVLCIGFRCYSEATGGGLEVVFKVLTVSKEPKCAGIAQVLCIEYFRYIGGVPSRAFHFEKSRVSN